MTAHSNWSLGVSCVREELIWKESFMEAQELSANPVLSPDKPLKG